MFLFVSPSFHIVVTSNVFQKVDIYTCEFNLFEIFTQGLGERVTLQNDGIFTVVKRPQPCSNSHILSAQLIPNSFAEYV